MKLKISLSVFFILAVGSLKAQLQDVPTEPWKTYEIDSKVLGEKRQIQVYLPKGYHNAQTSYPVLYLLDGQRLFEHAVSLAKSFDQFDLTPDFIIVGLSNKYPDRFTNFNTRSSLFADFIEEEVIRNIDTEFRTNEERMIFGWEYGGGFALTLMAKKPALFDGYITASAYPVSNKIEMIDSLLTSGIDKPIKLFLSSAEGEGIVNEEATLLKNLLAQMPTENLSWEYLELANEEHRSTPYSTLYHGIKNYYYYFPMLQFATLEEFKAFGGVESVKDYYSKRAAHYGFPDEVPQWTRFSIVRNAIRDDNLEEFNRLSMLYIDEAVILSLRNNQPYELTDYLVSKGMHQEAIEVYLILLKKRPESKRLLTKLATSYEGLDNSKAAKKYQKMAEEAKEK